ncbi:hypothetical protein D3C75_812310 [compost metagenome]
MVPSRCDIECEADAGSFLFAAAQADRAAKTFHDAFDQGQAYAEAALLGGVERLEHHPFLLLAHALAGIAEDELGTLPILHIDLGTQHAAFGHGFQGIGEQGVENLREL